MLVSAEGLLKRGEKKNGRKKKVMYFLDTSPSTVLLFDLKTHLGGFSSACVGGGLRLSV